MHTCNLMKFPPPILHARFITRYKRFFVDCTLETGEVVTAHCPNTGAMTGLLTEHCPVLLSKATNPNRKLAYTLEAMEENGTWVGVNTQRPNALVEEAIQQGEMHEFLGYASLRREVKYGSNSRVDILLENEGRPPCYVEVKNVHFKKENTAFFPDSVTLRGQKHMDELADILKTGARAACVFVVQRNDVDSFDFADFVDPIYAKKARDAHVAGVEMYAYTFTLNEKGITLCRRIPIL